MYYVRKYVDLLNGKVKLTWPMSIEWKSTECIEWVFWGCNIAVAPHTTGCVTDPTLSATPICHVGKHPPKLGTLPRLRDTTEYLKHEDALLHLVN